MGLELAKTLDLVKIGLTDPAGAWQKYFSEEKKWEDTALLLTAPLFVLYAFLVAALTALFGGGGPVPGGGFWALLISTLLGAIVGITVGAFVFSFLAGKLGGQSSFNKAFAALSVAWIPAALGGVVGAVVPVVGPLLGLAGAVLSLVYVYRLLPLALALPDSKRVLHFILGLVLGVIISVVVGSMVGLRGRGVAPQQVAPQQVAPQQVAPQQVAPQQVAPQQVAPQQVAESTSDSPKEAVRGSGLVGALQRFGETMETAGTHKYTPPEDGKLIKSQLKNYVDVQRKASKVRESFQQKIQEMEKSLEGQEKPGLAGLSTLGSTASGALQAQNAEMAIVVTGKGNWAEYSWVKSQIQTAMLHAGEGDEAIVHNYKLIQPYLFGLNP